MRLLYIDDDAALARLVQKDLTRHGFTVTLAGSCEEAHTRRETAEFDVIALDHYLPDCEGLEMLPGLLKGESPAPVVYVTGTQEGRVAVAALKAGAADYVIKDVAGDFTALLRTALEGAVGRAQLARAKEEAEAEVRAARDRAEALLREVNHRIGNSLQMVNSFISLQARSVEGEDARAALKATQARIGAVAQAHRRLYTSHNVESVDLQDYFEGLVDELRLSLAERAGAPRIQLTAEPVSTSPDKAVSLGVIAAELVTNALKYAYPQGGGVIEVRLTRDGDGEAVLGVVDDGVGFNGEAPAGTGLGRNILAAMATSLNSAIEYDSAGQGVRARLRFTP